MSKASKLYCPGDVIVLPFGPDRWIGYNVFTRTSLAMDAAALRIMSHPDAIESDVSGSTPNQFKVWDVEFFSNSNGLLADPTRLKRDASIDAAESLDAKGLVDRLKRHDLLITDEAEYRARLAPKTSVLDRRNFGNFHQQVGQHLLLKMREDPSKWWLSQKFKESLTELRDNLYRAVQGHNLERYIKDKFHAGMTVVDIGCGPGYYSNMIARTGADVIGIDPNDGYLQIARMNAPSNARYELMGGDAGHGCAMLDSAVADVVFISDTLLFYFVSPDPSLKPDLSDLFAEIRRLLKPGGRVIFVEPHYLFWLAPWFGSVDHPFTVFAEYRNRRFAVTPNLQDLIQAIAKQGFAISWMEEFYGDPEHVEVDPREYHFSAEYPLWHLYELAELPSAAGHASAH
jgi:SAM-dependent methyltransferase